jgi:putative MATE family efflux protein
MGEPPREIQRLAVDIEPAEPQPDHLTRGGIGAALWKLSAPVVLGHVLFTTLNLVDLMWIGRLGQAAATAAVFQGGRVTMVMSVVLMGLVTGSSALVSRAIGQRDVGRAAEALGQSILMILGFWALVGGTAWLFARPMYVFLGAGPKVADLGTGYLLILLSFSGMMGFQFALSAVLQSAGDTRTPLIMSIMSTLINAALDPVLIFLAGMGVAGAAWATVIARVASVAYGFIILFTGSRVIRLHWRQLLPRPGTIWRIVAIGLPTSLQSAVRHIGQLIVLMFVNPYGEQVMAGYGICQRIQMVPMIPGFGLGRSAGVLVGQNIGAGKPHRAVRSAWLTAAWFAGIMAVTGAVMLIFARPLIRLFLADAPEATINAGQSYLSFIVPALIPIAVSITLALSMRGAADTVSPLVITLIGMGIILLGAWWLGRPAVLGLHGVWLSMLVGECIRTVLMVAWFLRGGWKHKRAW